ncbi:MAG TPA: gliding motility-associated C-terminal domain-containing protein [Bacteroidia bacterium]
MKMKFAVYISIVVVIISNRSFAQCSFSLGNDTSYCQGQSFNLTLNAPAGMTNYLWSTGASTSSITVTTAGTYSCGVTQLSNDLITNGNFSSGNSGFSSSYIVGTGGTWGPLSNEGQYLVTTNASLAHNNFPSFTDHTGGGNMMVVNGSGTPGTSVWCQSITVIPNTNYNFSTWVATCVAGSATELSDLQFSINGNLLGSAFSPPMASGQWAQFSALWNSGSNTTASICIVNQNTTVSGNDFALDDIFFQQICTANDAITITENPSPTVSFAAPPAQLTCNVQTAQLNPTASPNVSYNWSGPNTTVADTLLNYTASDPGVYIITVTNSNNCTASASTTVAATSTFPIADAGPATQTIACPGLTITLSPTQQQSNYSYSWTGPNNFSSTSFSPGTVSTDGYYVLTATDLGTGCSKKDSVKIVTNNFPVASFSADPQSGNSPLDVHFTNNSSFATVYTWNFGEGNNINLTGNPEHIYLTDGSYHVMLVAGNGNPACKDTSYLEIVVLPNSALIIPNIFSPNGDNINDVFQLKAIAVKELTVDIYNRWGQHVLTFNGLTSSWSGKEYSEGTYYYLVKGNTEDHKLIDEKGTVQLVR